MSATSSFYERLTTTVAKELVAAGTGLVLVLFILGHLGGNLLIYLGPEMLNAYAEHLQSLGPGLWIIRAFMLTMLLGHICCVVSLHLASRRARGTRYAVNTYVGKRTVATRFMIVGGVLIFTFVLLHLYDFTLGHKEGPSTIVTGLADGAELGVYGMVFNGFTNPLRALIYILAMCAIGFHLRHGISSILVTVGALTEKDTTKADQLALIVAVLVTLGYSSIPLYVLVRNSMIGA
jgi:succinate dehydrogenase / fumarate reductase cytochrome b subunit